MRRRIVQQSSCHFYEVGNENWLCGVGLEFLKALSLGKSAYWKSQKHNLFSRWGSFFIAMRQDIGLSNRGIEAGLFLHLILLHASLFLASAKKS